MSPSCAVFIWFISLPPYLVYTLADLEQKFHDYLFTGETEFKLSHLTSARQKLHENIFEYIRQITDTRNRCYGLTISNRDLADLTFLVDLIFIKKLDGQEFLNVTQILQKAMANGSRAK